ncbi:hypothetical protein C8R43DRAFT_1141324 [Mycena crocata]|nr:hypothetical protein C8R43DRAFT_1141317 [Mycena crocata]KAJ7100579.1 hypothetical protein C8R43DRAFT_1141324 [Mycena crocata]
MNTFNLGFHLTQWIEVCAASFTGNEELTQVEPHDEPSWNAAPALIDFKLSVHNLALTHCWTTSADIDYPTYRRPARGAESQICLPLDLFKPRFEPSFFPQKNPNPPEANAGLDFTKSHFPSNPNPNPNLRTPAPYRNGLTYVLRTTTGPTPTPSACPTPIPSARPVPIPLGASHAGIVSDSDLRAAEHHTSAPRRFGAVLANDKPRPNRPVTA